MFTLYKWHNMSDWQCNANTLTFFQFSYHINHKLSRNFYSLKCKPAPKILDTCVMYLRHSDWIRPPPPQYRMILISNLLHYWTISRCTKSGFVKMRICQNKYLLGNSWCCTKRDTWKTSKVQSARLQNHAWMLWTTTETVM